MKAEGSVSHSCLKHTADSLPPGSELPQHIFLHKLIPPFHLPICSTTICKDLPFSWTSGQHLTSFSGLQSSPIWDHFLSVILVVLSNFISSLPVCIFWVFLIEAFQPGRAALLCWYLRCFFPSCAQQHQRLYQMWCHDCPFEASKVQKAPLPFDWLEHFVLRGLRMFVGA